MLDSAPRADASEWLDLVGLMPPLPLETAQALKKATGLDAGGSHTFRPTLVQGSDFETRIRPHLEAHLPPDVAAFVVARVRDTLTLRSKLNQLLPRIEAIVGPGNISALWLDREAFSADSMEHRALITEAVIHVYAPKALQDLVKLLSEAKIPMIPYGEGGGYNMGVTPMAPAVTLSVRGIDHISPIRESRLTKGRWEVSVGAGVPFKDLVHYLNKRGYVLRCDPNTPRAATGGIAATGSNGGRKAFEVILAGRVVGRDGTAMRFELDAKESQRVSEEPFLMARKFFGVDSHVELAQKVETSRQMAVAACISPNGQALKVPLVGSRAQAQHAAQKALADVPAQDTMASLPALPISAFVGAEGSTGFIYEVTFEIEKPLIWTQGARWHFSSVEGAMAATRALKKRPQPEQPTYFEFLSGNSIRRFLMADFPTVFKGDEAAVLFLETEGNTPEEVEQAMRRCRQTADEALRLGGYGSECLMRDAQTSIVRTDSHSMEVENMRRPREQLPKKLRTKCKTDMEIRTEYLGQVLKIVEETQPSSGSPEKVDVLFGHLTPNHTAIIHWNIGGFDLYDEEQADFAWEYLERVISKAQNLAPEGDPKGGSARFSGEHGIAGKAPFLWINHIPEADYARMCAIKDILDPSDLFNPKTLFLRTSHARALRARLLRVGQNAIEQAQLLPANPSEKTILDEALRCTRCNSCKVCPVIDAEHALARKGGRGAWARPVMPSKRNVLMFLERVVLMRQEGRKVSPQQAHEVESTTAAMLESSQDLLDKCFYCRRCDKSCPVNIEIHPLVRSYHALGKSLKRGHVLFSFLYERLMGEDALKSLWWRLLAFFTMLGAPLLWCVRRLPGVPQWAKTYTVPPSASLTHYEPLQEGLKLDGKDVAVTIAPQGVAPSAAPQVAGTVYLRFRGCADTFGTPDATRAVDAWFREVAQVSFVDLEKKMCCGFPFEADGLHERARQSQFRMVVEFLRAMARIRALAPDAKVVVFSNCPTCCEAIRESQQWLKEDPARLKLRAGLPEDTDLNLFKWETLDTVEVAQRVLKALEEGNRRTPVPFDKVVGLKVPCHNSKGATEAQMAFLAQHYTGVVAWDNCCGLSGTSRFKHPRIGTEISEALFDQIREAPAAVALSGCPSCRDGVRIQRDILQAEGDAVASFEVAGIFEQIVEDARARKGVHP